MKKFLLLAVMVVLAVGCTTKITAGGQTQRLEDGQKILIAVPADGAYGNEVYGGTGAEAAERLRAALSPAASEIVLSVARGDIQAALQEGRDGGFRYVVHPRITLWEHRVAAWSGRPTRVGLVMEVYDLEMGDTPVVQRSMDARGRIATLKSQFPIDIAETLFRQFAAETF